MKIETAMSILSESPLSSQIVENSAFTAKPD
jgi:hypothetical protein